MNNKRWLSLDLFKFIAIFIIVPFHSLVWWLATNDKSFDSNISKDIQDNMKMIMEFVTYIPICIPLSAGISMSFILKKTKLIENIKRGFLLILIGIVMNVLTWGIELAFNWDVLLFVGMCFIISSIIVKKFDEVTFIISGLIIFILTFFIRDIFFQFKHFFIIKILFGDPDGDMFFPFFPWFSIIVIGYIIGLNFQKNGLVSTMKKTLLFSLVFIIMGFFKRPVFLEIDPNNIWGPKLFLADWNQVLYTLGIINLVFSLLMLIESKINIKNFHQLIRPFSNGIMIIYVLHTIIFYNLTPIVRTYFEFNLFSALLYSMIQLGFFYFFVQFLIKKNIKINI